MAGSIIWARQLERQLSTYMQRIEHVLGEGWEEDSEGQKLKCEGEAFRDKLDGGRRFRKWQEEVLRGNREAMTLFNADTFLHNILCVTSAGGRRSEQAAALQLEVNFDTDKTLLVREVRSLSLLGFKLIPSVEAFAAALQRIHPYAVSLSEAIRIYFQAGARVEGRLAPLLAGRRRKMHCLLLLAVDERLLKKEKAKEVHRELKRDFERWRPAPPSLSPALVPLCACLCCMARGRIGLTARLGVLAAWLRAAQVAHLLGRLLQKTRAPCAYQSLRA